jgi:hypothetical protein
MEQDQFCDVDDDAPEEREHHDATMTEPRRPGDPPPRYLPVPLEELPPLPNVMPPPSWPGFSVLPPDHPRRGSLAQPRSGIPWPSNDVSIDGSAGDAAYCVPSRPPASKSEVSVISGADSSYNASTASPPLDPSTTTRRRSSSSSHASSVLAHEKGLAATRQDGGDNPHKRRFSLAIARPTTALATPAVVPIGGSILIPDSKVSTCSGLTHDAPMVVDATPPPVVAPKSALHRLYSQPPRRKILTSENFHTWHNDRPSHVRQWTALFVCPLTSELFFAGRYAPEEEGTATRSWFAKKATAEHAAAARAHDCCLYRDRITSPAPMAEERTPLGLEAPYFQPVFELPPDRGIPSDVRQKIMVQQEEIRSMHGLPPLYR